MKASLRALLTGLIDYAGQFPPAKLEMAEAVANYLRYREGEDAWMLGRFVCPAARLKELPEGVTLNCAAIGRGGDAAGFLAGVEADLREIMASAACVEVLEVKLPAELANHDLLAGVIDEILYPSVDAGVSVFLEPPTWEASQIETVVDVLAGYASPGPFGLKLRAGGLEPRAFPSSADLAHAIWYACREGVALKATAGLHHPLPRVDYDLGVRMHGFVNVFAAGVLARTRGLTEEFLRALLEDDEPAHFRPEEEALQWGDFEATTQQIIEAREWAVISFGSCSFDEPREDLRALGWM